MQYKIKRNLEHSGIKGQRWGVRRFQNEDGSLTEEGKKRYGTQTRKDENGKDIKVRVDNISDFTDSELKKYHSNINELEKNRQLIIDAENKDSKERIENARLGKDAADILNATANALPTGNGTYIKKDYSDITDDELRKRISRLQLEESYGRLTGETKYIKSGSEKTREVLQTTGAAIAIGSSAYILGEKIVKAIRNKK